MRLFIKIIFISLIVYFGGLYAGWWWIAVAAFLGGLLIRTSGVQSFFTGFIGVGMVWLWLILKTDMATESILTEKMARLFEIGPSLMIIILSVFVGSLVGALAAWTGHNLRKLIDARRYRGYYR